VRPTLFYLPFGLPIFGYGTTLYLSVLGGRRLAGRDGLDPSLVKRARTWALAGAIVGARLLYVVTHPPSFDTVTDVLAWRSFVELARADLDRGALGPMSTSQWIAAATFLTAAIA